MLLRRRFDVAQHGADVNRLAVVAAVIFAELLHAENIMQLVAPKCNEGGSRGDAKKFLRRISRINANEVCDDDRPHPDPLPRGEGKASARFRFIG